MFIIPCKIVAYCSLGLIQTFPTFQVIAEKSVMVFRHELGVRCLAFEHILQTLVEESLLMSEGAILVRRGGVVAIVVHILQRKGATGDVILNVLYKKYKLEKFDIMGRCTVWRNAVTKKVTIRATVSEASSLDGRLESLFGGGVLFCW